MIGFKLTVNGEAAIRRWTETLPDDFDDRAAKLVVAHGLDVEREAKQHAPVRFNRLRSSIHTRVIQAGDRIVAYIGTNVHYAPYVEFGTGLYGPRKRVIRPKRAKVLSWVTRGRGAYVTTRTGRTRYASAPPGQRVFARSVRGMRPQPYLIPALKRVRPRFERDLQRLADLMFPRTR